MPRIVIAEYNEPQRLSLVIQLTGLSPGKNYEVHDAEDGEGAFELIQRLESLDLLITDIEMPRLDGYGLIKRLGGAGYTNPVLVLATYFDRAKVDYNGTIEFISKMDTSGYGIIKEAVARLLNE